MKYGFEWTPGVVLLAMVLVLPIVPSFALIGLVVVALASVAALAALAAAVLAMPYLLVRSLRRRLAERHRTTEESGPIATAIAHAARATNGSGLTALAAVPQGRHGGSVMTGSGRRAP